MKHVYCILAYNDQAKLITSPVETVEGVCTWNKTFNGVNLSEEPSVLRVKVYNKQRNEIRDFFVGEGEVVMESADLMRLGVSDREGEVIGYMLMHVRGSNQ